MRALLHDMLACNEAWAHVAADDRRAVAALAAWGVVPAGETLCQQHTPSPALFCVLEGGLELQVDGRVMDRALPGAVLGLTSVLDDVPARHTVRAASGGAIVARIDATQLRAWAVAHPTVTAELRGASVAMAPGIAVAPRITSGLGLRAPRHDGPLDPHPLAPEATPHLAPLPTAILFAWPWGVAIDVAVASIALAWCTLAGPILAKYIVDEAWLRGAHQWVHPVAGVTVCAALVLFVLDCLRHDVLLHSAAERLAAVLRTVHGQLTRLQPSALPASQRQVSGPGLMLLGEVWALLLGALSAIASAMLLLYFGRGVGALVLGCVAIAVWGEEHGTLGRGVVSRTGYTLAHGACVVAGVLWVLRGDMSPGSWIGCMVATRGVTHALDALLVGWSNVEEVKRDTQELLAMQGWLAEADLLGGPERRPAPHPAGPTVALERVSFGYGETATGLQLRDLDLRIASGTWLGVVAPSGAGASTLAKLIVGAVAPRQGRIAHDADVGTALQQADDLAWLDGAAPAVHRSVRDSIALSRPDATLSEVQQAAVLAGAADFIARLPRGYSTVPGDAGVVLSTGQQQMLLVARLLLQRPRLIVLDHATSALHDSHERAWHTQLRRVLPQSTVVTITRRASTLRRCHGVILLENGEITARGTHVHLWDEIPRYRALVQPD